MKHLRKKTNRVKLFRVELDSPEAALRTAGAIQRHHPEFLVLHKEGSKVFTLEERTAPL